MFGTFFSVSHVSVNISTFNLTNSLILQSYTEKPIHFKRKQKFSSLTLYLSLKALMKPGSYHNNGIFHKFVIETILIKC